MKKIYNTMTLTIGESYIVTVGGHSMIKGGTVEIIHVQDREFGETMYKYLDPESAARCSGTRHRQTTEVLAALGLENRC